MEIIDCPVCKRRLCLPETPPPNSMQCPACHVVFKAKENAGADSFATSTGAGGNNAVQKDNTWKHPIGTPSIGKVENAGILRFELVPRELPGGTIRRTAALAGFLLGILTTLRGHFAEAFERNKSLLESAGELLMAIVVGVLVGVLFACMGAIGGIWLEVLLRLFKLRPGKSVLLTLAGDEEPQSRQKK